MIKKIYYLTMNNYFKYLSKLNDKSWGINIITCGHYYGEKGNSYPPLGHPKSHSFSWEEGRELDGCYLIYIPTGNGELETKNIKRKILPGDIMKIYPNEWHRYRPDKEVGWEEYWIGFKGDALEKYLLSSLFPNNTSEVANIGHHDEVIYLFNQALTLATKNTSGFTKILTGIVFQLVAYIEHPGYQALPGKKEDYICEEVISLIRQHFRKGIDFQHLAGNYGISYSHFRRLFREKVGLAPQQFLINERINYAKRLLSTTNLTVEEISEKCGFQSVFYFSKLFKKKAGYSPKKINLDY
ncbi:AraC family transcriptional regulator [Echinicola shivajiensis]|uniref:AraC family transcriptional regulator n=1 Tax=Echinicola shivajiensis TaxID=1035916 RepID=UPI001BFC7BDD|nr:AraC family transcriptional regulator [Echinicola shivajiensis]